MVEAINKKFPQLNLREGEEFSNHTKGSIWINTEDRAEDEKGMDIFNYYADGKAYELGVLVKFSKFIEARGWYAEWYDCGTIFLCEI